jgi:lysozyme family protein
MRALTKDDIKPMYKARYWDAVKADELPSGVDVSVADFGVNAGPGRAAKRLQRVVAAAQDGAIGPKTLAMVYNMDPVDILNKYADQREAYYRSLKTFEIYGNGWLRRNREVLEKALKMT